MHMTQWYYVDSNRQQLGPVAQDHLVQQYRLGNLTRDTLIWRDGMGQWQPLGDFIVEFGLSQAVESFVEPSPATGRIEPVLESTSSSVSAETEAAEEKPITGRAVFTARDPSYAQHAPPHASQAEAVSAAAAARAAPRDGFDSPYAPPTASLAAGTRVVEGGHVVYAGFRKRLAAHLIDSLIVGVIGGVIGMMIGGIMGAAMGFGGQTSGGTLVAIQVVTQLVSLGLTATYYAGFHSSRSMATPGKMAIGIKVVRTDGDQITVARGVGRYFATIISGLTLLIGYIMAAFTEQKRALHDMICDTLVVDKWAFTDRPEWQREELGTVTVVVLVLFGLLFVGVIVFAAILGASLASYAGR
jgi:uncharacterized RDD family membrane protein YckC